MRILIIISKNLGASPGNSPFLLSEILLIQHTVFFIHSTVFKMSIIGGSENR